MRANRTKEGDYGVVWDQRQSIIDVFIRGGADVDWTKKYHFERFNAPFHKVLAVMQLLKDPDHDYNYSVQYFTPEEFKAILGGGDG